MARLWHGAKSRRPTSLVLTNGCCAPFPANRPLVVSWCRLANLLNGTGPAWVAAQNVTFHGPLLWFHGLPDASITCTLLMVNVNVFGELLQEKFQVGRSTAEL